MPLSIASSTLIGIRGAPVEVEVDVATGIPAVRIVGLPDAAVGEARERIRSAIRSSGFTWPARRITVMVRRAPWVASPGSHALQNPPCSLLMCSHRSCWSTIRGYERGSVSVRRRCAKTEPSVHLRTRFL